MVTTPEVHDDRSWFGKVRDRVFVGVANFLLNRTTKQTRYIQSLVWEMGAEALHQHIAALIAAQVGETPSKGSGGYL